MNVKRSLVSLCVFAAMAALWPGAAPAQAVEIEVWVTMSPAEVNQIQALLPDFERSNPGIEVSVSGLTWAVYNDRVVSAFAAGLAPDVLMTGASFVWQVANKGLGIPLNKYVENWDGYADFAPSALQAAVYEGNIYGIPLQASTRAIWYRKDVFELAGVDAENPPDTWEEIRQVARRLMRWEGDRITRVGFNIPRDILHHAFLTNGVSWFNAGATRAAFNTEAGLEALAFWAEFAREMHYRAPGVQAGPLWEDGYGMILNYPPTYAVISQVDPDLWEKIGGPVVMRNRRKAAYTYPDWLYITTQSKHPDEAWAFIEWLTRPEILAEVKRHSMHTPPRRAVFEHEHYAGIAGELLRREFLEATLPYGSAFESWPDPLPMIDEFMRIWDSVALQEIPPQAGLLELERRFNILIEEAIGN